MNKKEKEFVETVWEFYRRHGRRSLPWRLTKNPYRVLISEVMLQQTQVDRVIPKYKAFIKKFPTAASLAQASLGDVLREWQGLGYNRRAKMLHECARVVYQNRRGLTPTIPRTYDELVRLPGIGPYTAGAVMAFAYNEAIPIIETNIRTTFMHHFFHDVADISDKEILRLTAVFLEGKKQKENPREWYWALMDYGAYLKKTVGNQNSRSKHYTKQSAFKNSDRQIRGAILRMLTAPKEKDIRRKASPCDLTRRMFHKALPFDLSRIDAQLERLREEGMIIKMGQKYSLPI